MLEISDTFGNYWWTVNAVRELTVIVKTYHRLYSTGFGRRQNGGHHRTVAVVHTHRPAD